MNTPIIDQQAHCGRAPGLRARLLGGLARHLRRQSIPIAATLLAFILGLPDELADLLADSPVRTQITECCDAAIKTGASEPLLNQTWNTSGQSIVLLAQAKEIASDIGTQLFSLLF